MSHLTCVSVVRFLNVFDMVPTDWRGAALFHACVTSLNAELPSIISACFIFVLSVSLQAAESGFSHCGLGCGLGVVAKWRPAEGSWQPIHMREEFEYMHSTTSRQDKHVTCCLPLLCCSMLLAVWEREKETVVARARTKQSVTRVGCGAFSLMKSGSLLLDCRSLNTQRFFWLPNIAWISYWFQKTAATCRLNDCEKTKIRNHTYLSQDISGCPSSVLYMSYSLNEEKIKNA